VVVAPDGAIWVSWPKKSARLATDRTDAVVRDTALPLASSISGLFDRRYLVRIEIRHSERAAIGSAPSRTDRSKQTPAIPGR
jgi:hypothetical protein